jgi:hypothetical protein
LSITTLFPSCTACCGASPITCTASDGVHCVSAGTRWQFTIASVTNVVGQTCPGGASPGPLNCPILDGTWTLCQTVLGGNYLCLWNDANCGGTPVDACACNVAALSWQLQISGASNQWTLTGSGACASAITYVQTANWKCNLNDTNTMALSADKCTGPATISIQRIL